MRYRNLITVFCSKIINKAPNKSKLKRQKIRESFKYSFTKYIFLVYNLSIYLKGEGL